MAAVSSSVGLAVAGWYRVNCRTVCIVITGGIDTDTLVVEQVQPGCFKGAQPVDTGNFFYLVVTPMGVIMRLFGYDPMGLKRKAENDSYRNTVTRHASEHFERPF
jgi:hypothetical protein